MNLPLELVREIVEIAVLSDYSTGPALALTCTYINRWITPLLYESVNLNKDNITSFIQGVEAAQCGTVDTGAYVKELCIHRNAMKHCDWTLSLCKSVSQLLLCPPYEYYTEEEEIVDASLWPNPWHIIILVVPPLWIRPRLALFTRATHLYLDDVSDPSTLSLCAKMPLTHICFSVWADAVMASDFTLVVNAVEFLLKLPGMQCVVIHALVHGAPIDDFFGGIWCLLADITDERFIVAPGMTRDVLIELFEEGQTVWDDVEEWKEWRQKVTPL